jgi:two-component system, NarL family, response regulator YdfI
MIRIAIRALSPLSEARLEQMVGGEPDFSIVGDEAAAGESAADVILVEAGQGEDPPGETLLDISGGGAAVVVLADDAPSFLTEEAIMGGVRGILPRSVVQAELAAALRAAAAGLIVVHPDDIGSYFPARPGGEAPGADREPLTPREVEVLRAMADGLSNKEIASRLGISDHTAKFHVGSVMGKLGAASRTEAVMKAVRSGLLMV